MFATRTKGQIILSVVVGTAIFLAGCGVKKEEHQRVVQELSEAKQQISELQTKLDRTQKEKAALTTLLEDTKRKVSEIENELQSTRQQITEITKETERLKKQDVYAFAEAGKILDSGQLPQALRAYQAFVRDFSDSTRVSEAKQHIQQIEQLLETQRKEAAARAERERKERELREFAERVRSGNLTPYQWWPLLRGKSMQEVKSLLGTPGHTGDDDREWTYYGMSIAPSSGKKEWLDVYFRGGIVVGVKGQSMNTIIQN